MLCYILPERLTHFCSFNTCSVLHFPLSRCVKQSFESSEDNLSAMSSDGVSEGTQFNWKIVNFSNRKSHETLRSSFFIAFSKEWVVEISSSSKNYVSVAVISCTSTVKHNLTCSVAFLGSDGIPLIWKEYKISPDNWCTITFFNELITVNRLNSNTTKFLPNDTLTVQCRMWRSSQGPTTPVSRFACTRIEPSTKAIKKIFTWDIVGVSSLEPPQSFERIVPITDGESATFRVTMNKEGKFYVFVKTSFNNVIHAKIEIAVLDASGGKIEFANEETEFKTRDQNWDLRTNVTKSMLLFYPNHFLPSDTLSLQFTCTFSGKVIFNRIVGENEFETNHLNPILPTVFLRLFENCWRKDSWRISNLE